MLKMENSKMHIQEMRLKAWQANLVQREAILEKREAILEKREAILAKREAILEKREAILEKHETNLEESKAVVEKHETNLEESKAAVEIRETKLKQNETELSNRKKEFNLVQEAILKTISERKKELQNIENPVPDPCDYKQIVKTMWQAQLNGAFGLSGLPVCDQVIQAMEELDKKERVLFISYSYYTVRQAQPNDPFQNLSTYVALDHVYAVTLNALYVLEWATGYGGTFGQVRLYGLSLPPQVRFRMNKCVDIPQLNWKSVESYVKHTNGIIHAQCPSTNIHMNIPYLKF